ncbi:hypothetical protein [Jatrophihabitans sp.]|jgi:hypothetical protein|uniref:hypothetical protein n=1 Tax=Jatrophihabitans sp. TaxID=1932789 RepID=UPI002EDD77B6
MADAVDPSAETPEIDPREFLRAVLNIDPKDAEKARQDSPATRSRRAQEGPTHDYGDDRPAED